MKIHCNNNSHNNNNHESSLCDFVIFVLDIIDKRFFKFFGPLVESKQFQGSNLHKKIPKDYQMSGRGYSYPLSTNHFL